MNRQYIGARYVPKFFENPNGSNEWINGIGYEPLTIVTYLNNSFTSKKAVPVGINVLNTDYWVNTGNYNSQVAEYQQQIINLTTEVNNQFNVINGRLNTIEAKEVRAFVDEKTQNINLTFDKVTYLNSGIYISPKSTAIFEISFNNTNSSGANFGIGYGKNNTSTELTQLERLDKMSGIAINEKISTTFIAINTDTAPITLYLYAYTNAQNCVINNLKILSIRANASYDSSRELNII